MESMELFYPEILVTVEDYTFKNGIEIEVHSSKSSYFDWAKIRFTKEFQNKISIKKRAKSTISLGYNGTLNNVFNGYVSTSYNNNEILLKDSMILLEDTYITNTFIDAAPQEIITYCLTKAGIENFKLSNAIYQSKKNIPVFSKNVIDVINMINSMWKISIEFFFSHGIFYWGEKPMQDKIYSFEYGKTIIALSCVNNMWELETVSAPFIRHSQVININHPQISGNFEVKKIMFITNETGFIRTLIYF